MQKEDGLSAQGARLLNGLRLVRLIAVSFLEHMPYRPLNCVWRLKGMWNFMMGRNAWQVMDRVGFSGNTAPDGNTALS